MNRSVVVVVAHPDDETLWAGGYLAAHPGTTIVCCSVPEKDPQRVRPFFEVCRQLKARPVVAAASLAANEETLDLWPAQLIAEQFDLILTHNRLGEYGHGHHIDVHHAMHALGKPMKVFGYGLTKEGEAVDIKLKERLLSLYTTRPEVFARQSKKFDLSKEAFIDG